MARGYDRTPTGARLMVPRVIRALTDISTRRAVWDYLRMVALIMFILLAIAWTIDLAENFARLAETAELDNVSVLSILAPYLSYRTADMVVRMFPMACFFGVFLAELGRRARLETIILAAAGASYLRALSGVVVFGMLAGGLQYWLESHGRPAAILAQVELGQGGYARRFAQVWSRDHTWFVSNDIAIRAQFKRVEPPELKDALVFTGLQAERLKTVFSAEKIVYSVNTGDWHMSGVQEWDADAALPTAQAVADLTIALPLVPEQVRWRFVPAFYLPTEPVRRLAEQSFDARAQADAQVALWRRTTAWLLPGTMAFLAVMLASLGYDGRRPNVARLIGMAAFGYICVVSVKVLWAVGELQGLGPAAAVLASICGIGVISSIILAHQSGIRWRVWRRSHPR